MADHTHIEWADATWNPITGCSVVSPGCTNCYAMKLAGTRLKDHPSRAGLTTPSKAGPVWNGHVRLNEAWLDQPLRWRKPKAIFVCAHGDLFHEAVADEWIDRVFAVMALAPQHTFIVLTKRPARMKAYLNTAGRGDFIEDWMRPEIEERTDPLARRHDDLRAIALEPNDGGEYVPLPNVWLGVSAEDQARANERLPILRRTPAAKRLVSLEPLLGAIDLTAIETGRSERLNALTGEIYGVGRNGAKAWREGDPRGGLDWAIVGGESQRGARPMHPDWARQIRDACAAAGVPFFFKRWGDLAWAERVAGDPTTLTPYRAGKKAAGRLLDGRTWDERPRAEAA